MALTDRWQDMWRDQFQLNKLFRPDGPPTTYPERTALTKELVLHLHSETDELLRKSGSWKLHRRQDVPENRAAILEELTDIHKYVISLYQVWGFSAAEAVESFRRKDMVVRQRHAEEWVKTVDQPSAVVDIDGVLANYVEGFMAFLAKESTVPAAVLAQLQHAVWIDQRTVEPYITPEEYRHLRHMFRVSGWHGRLPMIPGAHTFLDWLREDLQLQIILVTSRPIHDYPNLHTDTVFWLNELGLPYDFIWWTQDKGKLILERDLTPHVRLAVDDDWAFVTQLAGVGIDTFWMNRGAATTPRHHFGFDPGEETTSHIHEVKSLEEIMTFIEHGETA